MITEEYRRQQKALHAKGDYGTMGRIFGPPVSEVAMKFRAESVLDYGCGSKQSLKESLDGSLKYVGYDPCVDAFSAEPEPADMVACIDVMEHVEPDFTEQTIARLRSLMRKVAFVTIHTGPAMKVLPDGRNAHLVQQPARWWLPLFCRHFDVEMVVGMKHGFWMVLT